MATFTRCYLFKWFHKLLEPHKDKKICVSPWDPNCNILLHLHLSYAVFFWTLYKCCCLSMGWFTITCYINHQGVFLWWGWGGGLTFCYYSAVVSDHCFSTCLFLSLTGLNHKDNDNMDYYYQLEIWKGNINGVLRQAREREELSDWLVAMAPMGKSSSQFLV